jgi:glyoxylase-like metal-dependent hydrolase (beta-lactamase superfamily II)
MLVAGDLVFYGRYPNIDFVYGGSIDGMIRGTEGLLNFAKEDTKIVPGHGPAGTKAMMRRVSDNARRGSRAHRETQGRWQDTRPRSSTR